MDGRRSLRRLFKPINIDIIYALTKKFCVKNQSDNDRIRVSIFCNPKVFSVIATCCLADSLRYLPFFIKSLSVVTGWNGLCCLQLGILNCVLRITDF